VLNQIIGVGLFPNNGVGLFPNNGFGLFP